MAVAKILCITLLMAFANGKNLDLSDLFGHADTKNSDAISQKPTPNPVNKYEQEYLFSQMFDSSSLEIFDVKPKYDYKYFQSDSDSGSGDGEIATSYYQGELFINDLAAPVTAEPSSKRAVHDIDDVEFTPVHRKPRNKFISERLTDDYQDDEVVDRSRREETEFEVVEYGLEDGYDPDAFNMEMSSLRNEAGSPIQGINKASSDNQDYGIGIGRSDGMVTEDVSGREQIEPCEVQRNKEQNNLYDYTCGCNQNLGPDRPIGHLTLDHTGCIESDALWIHWNELESSLSPQSITFVGVSLKLTGQTRDEEFISTVKKLTFKNSNFMNISIDAFKGLKALEELRFFDSIIIEIQENAVRNHDNLKVFEIVKSRIGIINQNSFNDLPAIEDFAITQSTVKEIQSLGININKNTGADESANCRGRNGRTSMDDIVMGRQIKGADDLNLPEFGKRFLLYKSSIEAIRTSAVSSNVFGFLILGGNNISLIESQAFKMQLDNPCEISAALLASNVITKLSNQSFTGIRNKMNSNNTTFIALNHNTFIDVDVQGFQIEKSITIFSVDENKFKCDCPYLYWLINNKQSANSFQTELKMQLISKAKCTTGENVTTFHTSCEDKPTYKPTWPQTQTHMPVTLPSSYPETTEGSAACQSNLVNVFATVSIFILINLHRALLY